MRTSTITNKTGLNFGRVRELLGSGNRFYRELESLRTVDSCIKKAASTNCQKEKMENFSKALDLANTFTKCRKIREAIPWNENDFRYKCICKAVMFATRTEHVHWIKKQHQCSQHSWLLDQADMALIRICSK